MFRPGLITPLPGTTAKTKAYTLLYRVLAPLALLLRGIAPRHITSSTNIGRAMIRTVRAGAPCRTLSSADINTLAAASPPAR
ncbi:hypothetical protein ACU686_34625 [Yinghuangia aomiensis]